MNRTLGGPQYRQYVLCEKQIDHKRHKDTERISYKIYTVISLKIIELQICIHEGQWNIQSPQTGLYTVSHHKKHFER